MQLIPETPGLYWIVLCFEGYDRSKKRSCPFKSSGCWGFKFASGLNKIHEMWPFWDPCVVSIHPCCLRKSSETNTVRDVFSTFWHYIFHVCLVLLTSMCVWHYTFFHPYDRPLNQLMCFFCSYFLFHSGPLCKKNTCSSCQLKSW